MRVSDVRNTKIQHSIFDESLALSRIKRTLFGAKRWRGLKPKKVKVVKRWKKAKNIRKITKKPKKRPYWKQSMLKIKYFLKGRDL